jgi:hypothetical protein
MNLNYVKSVAKAIAAGLVAAIGSLLIVMPETGTFGDVTVHQWLLVALNILGAYGVVWAVPNTAIDNA